MKSGRSVRLGSAWETRSIRLSVESRRYLSFSVFIVNIEVAPDTVNFAAPRQHCWGLKWDAGARRKRYVCDLTKRQERSKCLLTRDVYLPGVRQTPSPLERYTFNKMRFENHVMRPCICSASFTVNAKTESLNYAYLYYHFHHIAYQNSFLQCSVYYFRCKYFHLSYISKI